MLRKLLGPLSREEQDLVRFYRALPMPLQNELLQRAEASHNAVLRMKELMSRDVEKSFPYDENGLH
ncbi:MAG: hypothetical protein C0617_05295 [Desulfuromonas sp.]|uniref:hypothetical protein n=1 Tax=Desulfuromonas sp. TaxID=892 RepID=UPI000CBD50F8|nr:hypothetical protein [Desulfuromonas sp.]PLX85105.1 MAG: hypothetical protein C0617_05295 [Desulfuromonas sp.]